MRTRRVAIKLIHAQNTSFCRHVGNQRSYPKLDCPKQSTDNFASINDSNSKQSSGNNFVKPGVNLPCQRPKRQRLENANLSLGGRIKTCSQMGQTANFVDLKTGAPSIFRTICTSGRRKESQCVDQEQSLFQELNTYWAFLVKTLSICVLISTQQNWALPKSIRLRVGKWGRTSFAFILLGTGKFFEISLNMSARAALENLWVSHKLSNSLKKFSVDVCDPAKSGNPSSWNKETLSGSKRGTFSSSASIRSNLTGVVLRLIVKWSLWLGVLSSNGSTQLREKEGFSFWAIGVLCLTGLIDNSISPKADSYDSDWSLFSIFPIRGPYSTRLGGSFSIKIFLTGVTGVSTFSNLRFFGVRTFPQSRNFFSLRAQDLWGTGHHVQFCEGTSNQY